MQINLYDYIADFICLFTLLVIDTDIDFFCLTNVDFPNNKTNQYLYCDPDQAVTKDESMLYMIFIFQLSKNFLLMWIFPHVPWDRSPNVHL